jgi:hypothetical protein
MTATRNQRWADLGVLVGAICDAGFTSTAHVQWQHHDDAHGFGYIEFNLGQANMERLDALRAVVEPLDGRVMLVDAHDTGPVNVRVWGPS